MSWNVMLYGELRKTHKYDNSFVSSACLAYIKCIFLEWKKLYGNDKKIIKIRSETYFHLIILSIKKCIHSILTVAHSWS